MLRTLVLLNSQTDSGLWVNWGRHGFGAGVEDCDVVGELD